MTKAREFQIWAGFHKLPPATDIAAQFQRFSTLLRIPFFYLSKELKHSLISLINLVSTETVSPEDLKPVALSLNKRRKKVMEMLKNDPRKITANIVLEHSKFSCEIEENEISQEGQASASVTSQCFDSELKVKEIIDKGLSTVNFPTATNCYSNELEPSQVVHRPEINKCLTSTADEIESSLFLENIWDIVSVDEFADIIRNFFEQHA